MLNMISISLFYCCEKMFPLWIHGWLGKIKGRFTSHLNIGDITDVDYTFAKRVCKDFKVKNLEEYHDLYV